ncbi:hypothetical protein BKA69DRAFT_1056696 [Paraphysoderma sedebokerense]|nr:hypothetical protein BKA69DRAFT_1056696 [Paraphysoderma sedebokerense]
MLASLIQYSSSANIYLFALAPNMSHNLKIYLLGFTIISMAAASGNIVSAINAFQNDSTIEAALAIAAAVLTVPIWIALFKTPDSKVGTMGLLSLYCAVAIAYSVIYAERVPLKATLMILHWLYLSFAGLYLHKFQCNKKTAQTTVLCK